MKVIVHRGQNQIGGNIIEITTAKTRILLDAGNELDKDEVTLPAIEGLFDNPSFDAVFISHYHGDHLGLAYYIDNSIPLYIGEASYRIVRAADDYKGINSISPDGFLRHLQPIGVGDITVTPFLCDHSAFDSYMFLCEAEGEKILYTGDFRSNGRKSFQRLLQVLPDKVDKLICEGTTLSREAAVPARESDLENLAVTEFEKTTGPIFVLQSTTNIDRIVTMYRAAKRSERVFLQEIYMAEVTSAIGGSIPNPGFSDVYAFLIDSKWYDTLVKYRRMGMKRMAQTPFVMCVRSSMLQYLRGLNKLMSFENGLLVFSMWNGYKQQPAMKRFIETCEGMGLKTINLHTSGHADPDTILALISKVNPTEIIPVHTENAAWFDNVKPQ